MFLHPRYSSKTDRPKRRTALVTRELGRYYIQIAAFGETRFADKGQLTEVKAGCNFFWSVCSSDEHREAGVGFAIRSNLIIKLATLPKGFNDRPMSLQFPLKEKRHATFINAYAPTMTSPEEIKDKFYEDLESLIASVTKEDRLVILGDFNTRVCVDYQTWEGVIGRNCVGKSNSNGHLLLKTCVAHDLLITNTVFHLHNPKKMSWMHPGSKHRHLGDYVINTCQHEDWFGDNDEDIQKLQDEKCEAFRFLQQDTTSVSKKAAYSSIRIKVQAKLREMQDSWLSRKADEIQKYTDSNNSKHFYNALETIYGQQSSGTSPMFSADRSTLLTDKYASNRRWAEHFNNVLNRPSSINAEAIDHMPQVAINTSLAEPPKESEVKEATKLTSNGKATGSDSIPAAIYKAGGPVLLQKLTKLFQTMWQQEIIHQELKDASIVHLYKRKGNRQSCDNHSKLSPRHCQQNPYPSRPQLPHSTHGRWTPARESV
ncbi:hypothetical protein NDU88_001022 [Pleurodeles waltl]|uniref:Endonuclease/exonuclease/phosphatase domain-containing protein n=1 Tax=Pleurodeles waltl TaxID=8319 RepID=A0AAV7SB54_PLEWA|nr:hypothetical protein NDU88_001022 [Pleurodeles waltl]